MKRYILSIIMLLIFIVGCSTNEDDTYKNVEETELKPVTFVLDWTPNTNHTGIYVAKKKVFLKRKV